MTHLRNRKGFTLVEIISVVLILGIVAAVVVPMMDTSSVEVSVSASTIEGDLRFIQELAMSRNPATGTPVSIVFSAGATTYAITDPSGLYDTSRTLPDGVTILSGGTISFNKFGEPTSIASIQVKEGSSVKTITVEQFTGRVTVS